MASVFTHAVVAVALGKVYADEDAPARFWFLSAACAVLPDADVVGFAFAPSLRRTRSAIGASLAVALFALLVAFAVLRASSCVKAAGDSARRSSATSSS